jgi:hypothetical protein
MRVGVAVAGGIFVAGAGSPGCVSCKADTAWTVLEFAIAAEDRKLLVNEDGSDNLSEIAKFCDARGPEGQLIGLGAVARCAGDVDELDCVECTYWEECY